MIRLSKSVVGQQEIDAVRAVMEKGYLGMGAEVQLFEKELKAYLGGDVIVTCVNTGTAALHLALQAIGIAPGDEVLIPSLTYVASFQAVSATGGVPVACEVQDADGLIDLRDAEKRITPKTRAIMPVHYASTLGNLDAVYEFAEKHQLRVIEDAAHAFGCEYQGKKVGSFGDVICFSFDGIKNITSGEGGAVVTQDAQVAAKVQDARLLAVQKDTEKRFSGQRSWDFDVTEQGWRYHMSDIMAAIGRVQLKRFEPEFKPKRMKLAALYRKLLSDVPGIRLLVEGPGVIVPHIFPVRVQPAKREQIRNALQAQDVQFGIHYKPNHLLTKFGGAKERLPIVENLYEELVTLPLHPEVTESDVEKIVSIIRETLKAE